MPSPPHISEFPSGVAFDVGVGVRVGSAAQRVRGDHDTQLRAEKVVGADDTQRVPHESIPSPTQSRAIGVDQLSGSAVPFRDPLEPNPAWRVPHVPAPNRGTEQHRLRGAGCMYGETTSRCGVGSETVLSQSDTPCTSSVSKAHQELWVRVSSFAPGLVRPKIHWSVMNPERQRCTSNLISGRAGRIETNDILGGLLAREKPHESNAIRRRS